MELLVNNLAAQVRRPERKKERETWKGREKDVREVKRRKEKGTERREYTENEIEKSTKKKYRTKKK